MKPKKHLLSLGLALSASLTASAIDITWDTDPAAGIQGGAGTWDATITNWTADGGVTLFAWNNTANAADTAIFGGSGGEVSLGTPITAGSLTIGDSYIFSGETLTTTEISVTDAAHTARFDNVLAGGPLLKTGGGTLLLAASNTYNGGTTISSGTLLLGSSAAAGITTGTTRAITLGDAATGAGTPTLLIDTPTAGAITTVSNPLIVQAIDGTPLIGSSPDTTSGRSATFSGAITLLDDVILNSGSYDGTTFSGAITGNHHITIRNGAGGTYGSGSNVRGHVGNRVILSGANSFGDVTIESGTATSQTMLQLNGSNNVIPDTSNVTVRENAIFRLFKNEAINGLNGAGIVTGVVSAYTLTLGAGNGDGEFSGILRNDTGDGGSLAVTKTGTGTQIFSGGAANTYTGLTRVSAGQLTIHKNDAVQAISTGGLLIEGAGKVVLTDTRSNRIHDSADVTLNGPGAVLEIHRNLSESVRLLTVNGGTVNLVNNGTAGLQVINFRSTGITATDGSVFNIGHPSATGAASLIFLGSGGFTGSGTVNINALNANAQVSLNGATRTFDITGGTTTIAPRIIDGTGTGNLVKTGPGSLELTGTNTYNGSTSVNEGTLVLTSGSSLSDTAPLIIAGDAVLHLPNEGTDIVGELVIGVLNNGAPLPGGLYDSGNTNGAITGLGKIQVIGSLATPFEDWISTNYPDLAENEPSDDPDGDGVPNLLEFAINGDPSDGSDNGLGASLIEDNRLKLVIAVRDGAAFNGGATATVDGVTYTVEGSLDLNFPGSAVSSTGPSSTAPAATGLPALTGTDWEYHVFTLDASVGLPGKGFLRLNLTQP